LRAVARSDAPTLAGMALEVKGTILILDDRCWLKAAVLHIADSRLLLYGKQTFRIPEGDSKPAARCGNLICNFTNQMTDRFRLIRKEHL
jgi:hypothetical protein